MYKIIGFFSPLLFSSALLGSQFGHISHSTFNIGDDFQTIAAKRFLPDDSIGIDREFVSVFTNDTIVKTIVNGWYIYTKNYHWYREDKEPPEVSWPPSASIDPLFISIHFTENILPLILSDEGVAYLKNHAPIGARDLFTLKELQKKDIPSYFSGCLTLTFDQYEGERSETIYVVDLDEACINYVQAHTNNPVEVLTQIIDVELSQKPKERLQHTLDMLEKYKTAKCVITSRLHVFLPCLAFGTPVLLVNIQSDQYRFDGLRELGHNGSEEQLLNGEIEYDFDSPPENPSEYLHFRKQLIETVTTWMNY